MNETTPTKGLSDFRQFEMNKNQQSEATGAHHNSNNGYTYYYYYSYSYSSYNNSFSMNCCGNANGVW